MNMKLKFLLAPALVLISGAGLWGQAAAPAAGGATGSAAGPATKIALINMQEAIATTSEGKTRIAELDKKYSPKQQEFQKRGSDIQAKTDQLKKTQNTLSDEAKATAEAEITRLKTALQRDTDDATADSEADQQKMLQELGPKLVNAVTKYSQDNQIMIVFDLSSQPNNLVCCASAPDITREVIALYDKMNPAGGAGAAATQAPAKPATPSASRPPASTPAKPAGTAPTK
jgi:Skp family chaperone for outer membrane proteins